MTLKRRIAHASLGLAVVAPHIPAQSYCSASDASQLAYYQYCTSNDYDLVADIYGQNDSLTYHYGGATARNACVPEYRDCNGSQHAPQEWQGSESLVSYISGGGGPDITFYWNINNQYANLLSCNTPDGGIGSDLTQYVITDQVGFSDVYCN
jgi:hypothetical protein